MPATLEYDSKLAPTPMVWLHRIALTCGLVPMIVGTAVFLLFVITRSIDFAIFGFFTLIGGCAATFVAAVCLGVYWFQARRATPADADIARRHLKRDAIILVLNFPLGGLFAGIGIWMLNKHEASVNIVIRNDDAVIIDRIRLETGGDTRDFGPIASGASDAARMEFGGAGLTATVTPRFGGPSSPPHRIFDHMDADTVPATQDLRLVIRKGDVVLQE